MDDADVARQLQQEFDEEVRRKEERERFDCPLCLDTSRLDEGVELDCLHRICRGCFSTYVTLQIREKRVKDSELCCPMPACQQPVTVHQVEGAMQGTALWDRFLEARLDLWRPTPSAPSCGRKLPERERLYECPTPNCGNRFLVSPRMADVTCPKCTQSFCRLCQQRHPGQTCAAFAASKPRTREDKEFEALIVQNGWQKCPRCNAVTDREVGCNYMTCQSEICRGRVSFCYLCGVELSAAEHFTHFPFGLFENRCRNVDRRGEKELPTATWGTTEWWSAVVRDVKSAIVG